MKKVRYFVLGLLIPAIIGATVYNYFPPPGSGYTPGKFGLGLTPNCTLSARITSCPPTSGLLQFYNADAGTNHANFIAESDGVAASEAGGVFQISAGNGASPNGNGGSLDLYSGFGLGSGTAGRVDIVGGNSTSGHAGTVQLTGGSATTTGSIAGDANLVAGNAGTAGNVTLKSGNASLLNQGGGLISVLGGTASNGGGGGAVNVTGGNGDPVHPGANTFGGSINFLGGQAVGTATGGAITLQPGSGNTTSLNGIVDILDGCGIDNAILDTHGSWTFTTDGACGGVPPKIDAIPIATNFTAVSGSIGGAALLAGACSTGTVTVTGAATSMVAITDPNTYPGDGTLWDAQVTAANTVTVKVCAIIALTPTASTYNVRVFK